MAPHSSTLAWKIPWMEEPGGLQSMGLRRVGHDWATSLSPFTSCTGEGNGYPLQYSCLENPRDRGAWWAAVYEVAQSQTWLTWLNSIRLTWGFPISSVGKESICNAGDPGLIPGLVRSPGEGNGYPLQYPGLENSIDCIVHGVTKSWIQLSNFHFQASLVLSRQFSFLKDEPYIFRLRFKYLLPLVYV